MIAARLRRTPQPLSRSGFTVLELIVALTLGLVLLSAIWTMFRLFLRHQEIETAQVQRVQLVSSLHQLLSRDLLNVIPEGREGPRNSSSPNPVSDPAVITPDPAAELFLFPGTLGPAPLGATPLTDLLPPENSRAPGFDLPTSSLKGDSNRLELAVFATAEDMLSGDASEQPNSRSSISNEGPPPTSPTKVVTYEFRGLSNEFESIDLNPNPLLDIDAEEDDPLEQIAARVGLWRREQIASPANSLASLGGMASGDRSLGSSTSATREGLTSSRETTASAPTTSQIEEFAPEIIDLEFDYFDGQKWSSSWDSQNQKQLPVLVRVRLAVETRTALRKRKLEERLESGLIDEPDATLETEPPQSVLATSTELPPLDDAWDYQFLLFVTPPSGKSSSSSGLPSNILTPSAKPSTNSGISGGRAP